MDDDGTINFTFKNHKYDNKPYEIEDGNYSCKVSKEKLDELLYVMRYKNITVGKKIFSSSMLHDTPYKIAFDLENGEKIEYKLYFAIGPPELRILEGNIYSLMKKLASKN